VGLCTIELEYRIVNAGASYQDTFAVTVQIEVTQLITCVSFDTIPFYDSFEYAANSPMVSSSIATPVIRNSNGEEVVDPLVTCAVTTSI